MTTAAEIRAIEDVWDRASAAQKALRIVEPKLKKIRAARDAAALALIAPYMDAARESNEYRAAAKDRYTGYWTRQDGEKVASTKKAADQYRKAHPDTQIVYHRPSIGAAEYNEQLAIAREMRQEAFAASSENILDPEKVYRALGMHRNLLERLKNRRGAAVPALKDPMKVGQNAHKDLVQLTPVATELRKIRDDAIDKMIAQAVPGVDIANHLGISPARVNQIRHGSRR